MIAALVIMFLAFALLFLVDLGEDVPDDVWKR